MKNRHWVDVVCGLGLGLLAVWAVPGGCLLPQQEAPTAKTVTLQTIATGLGSPVGMAAPNDGTRRLFVVDQGGVIRVIANGLLVDTPLLDVRSELDAPTSASDERGLLGLALHPDFATNGRLFVYFNTPPSADAPAGTATEVRLSEFNVHASAPDVVDGTSERILFRLAKPQANHNAGQLAFGPDGYLYIAVGDGGGANDDEFGHTPGLGNGQDTTNLLGKILRIDVDSGDPYGIPVTNPFAGSTTSRPEIFAYGFRNPWRFSFDSGSGGLGQLFVGDVGQALTEEVDIVTPGGDYGWNIKEGTLCFNTADHNLPLATCSATAANGVRLIDPILEYRHTDTLGAPFGSAVIGGFVYRGTAVPGLVGLYVFGDYMIEGTNTGRLFLGHQVLGGTWTFDELTVAGTTDGRLGRFVLSFGRDTKGELYVLSRGAGGPSGTTGMVEQIVGLE
jgi:glucose/arabinose dehydrogenase